MWPCQAGSIFPPLLPPPVARPPAVVSPPSCFFSAPLWLFCSFFISRRFGSGQHRVFWLQLLLLSPSCCSTSSCCFFSSFCFFCFSFLLKHFNSGWHSRFLSIQLVVSILHFLILPSCFDWDISIELFNAIRAGLGSSHGFV